VAGGADLERAEREAEFAVEQGIRMLFCTDDDYPSRLRDCPDAPVMLFMTGNADLNAKHAISIVGTRKATSYGRRVCRELLDGLRDFRPLVISGLAYGIDIEAHKASIDLGFPTIACLAHGLDRIYPPDHALVANKMMRNGGLITEFLPNTRPDRELFPMRNRIVAGLGDCTVVVESDVSGGSMLTAHIAASYNRDVFAIPGRVHDKFSAGCHKLIAANTAAMLVSSQSLVEAMGWGKKAEVKKQLTLPLDLSENELKVVETLRSSERMYIDDLTICTGIAASVLAGILLELEFRNVVTSLPGKYYQLS
jgi:DNA processing protein